MENHVVTDKDLLTRKITESVHDWVWILYGTLYYEKQIIWEPLHAFLINMFISLNVNKNKVKYR